MRLSCRMGGFSIGRPGVFGNPPFLEPKVFRCGPMRIEWPEHRPPPEKTIMTPVALITGGSKRIGKAIALALAEDGFDIALHYNTSRQAAEKTAEEIEQLGRRCETLPADLSDPRQVEAILPKLIEIFGRCDLLVNNASIFDKASLAQTDGNLLDRTMAINFRAPLLLTRDFARLCEAGHVVNLLDTRIAGAKTAYFVYSLSKKALAEMTRLAARELGPTIRVNGVCPGLVLEPPGVDPGSGYLEGLAEKIPLQRRGSVEDVVRAVMYLVTSPFVTGELLFIDGGEKLI